MGETTSTRKLTRARLAKAPAKREFSAGGVVFKKVDSQTFWLITKTSPSDLFPKPWWRLPKGWIDNEEETVPGPMARGDRKATEAELHEAALREVKEEAGVIGRVISKVGTIKFFFNLNGQKILKFVTFYLIEWTRDLPDGPGFETSEVLWLQFEEAIKTLKHSSEKQMLKKAKEILERGQQQNLI